MISRLERAVNAWDFSLRAEAVTQMCSRSCRYKECTGDFNHKHRCCFIVINKQAI